MAAVMDLPLSTLYLTPVSQWLDAEPLHGVEFLDAVAIEGRVIRSDTFVSRSFAEQNLNTILAYALTSGLAAKPEPQRVMRWLYCGAQQYRTNAC